MKSIGDLLDKIYEQKSIKEQRLKQLEQKYDRVRDCDNCFFVWKDDLRGVVLFEDNEEREIMFDGVKQISRTSCPKREDDIFCVRKNSGWGYIDSSQHEIVPCIYDDEDFLGFPSFKYV